MVCPLTHQMIKRARQHLLLLVLLIIVLLVGVALGYHLLELRQVAEAALTGLVGLAINVRSMRL